MNQNQRSTSSSGRAWNNTTEYPSLKSDLYKNDEKLVLSDIARFEKMGAGVAGVLSRIGTLTETELKEHFETCFAALNLSQNIDKILANLYTYISCELSIDGQNEEAKQARSIVEPLYARFAQASEPFSQFLLRMSDQNFENFFKNENVKGDKFRFAYERKQSHSLLSLDQEQMLMAMGLSGFTAWGNLYDTVTTNLRGTLNLKEGPKTVGVAELAGYIQSADESIRKMAWDLRNQMWESQEDVCASTLNSIAGWRIEMNKLRSHTKPVDFLDSPLHKNRIEKATLEAMLGAVTDKSSLIQKAFKTMAKALRKSKLNAWDLSAPAPKFGESKKQEFPYKEAIQIVADAFQRVDPAMGEFVKMMDSKEWIEGRVLPSKKHGAYCTTFAKSQTPRVFMTYQGNMSNVTTLAHELGHALHFWEIRELPDGEKGIPMTLAETASVFAETVTREALEQRAQNVHEKFASAWNDAQAAIAFLLGIPARFEFEKSFYSLRKEREVSATELKKMMTDSMQKHYGSDVEAGPMYMGWTTTLHYYITELSFYNFPYTFGYLFALGIYAQWQKLGKDFYPKYIAILRDTGRMSPEDLIQKHLQMDITKKEFWYESIRIVEDKLENFKRLTDEVCQ